MWAVSGMHARYHRRMTFRYLDEAPDVLNALARVRVLYTDLDGTLLGRGASVLRDDAGEPTLDTARAIVEVNRADLTVVLVSGRNFIQLAEDSRLLGWTDFIGEVGALRSTGRDRHVEYELGDWPSDAVPAGMTPYEAILEAGALDMLQTAFPGRIERHVPWDSDRVVTFILRGEVEIEQAQAVLDQIDLPVEIVDNGIIHPVDHTLVGVGQIHAYHLVPKGTSKVRAIADDLAARGLRPEQAAAIGDSAADLKMAEAVGIMVIVANGLDTPAVRARLTELPNAVATRARQGHGWAEFADAWLAARSASQ
jgi:hydroxymethylpyrimidine pyrophosphatase-like HAD family hydrolase